MAVPSIIWMNNPRAVLLQTQFGQFPGRRAGDSQMRTVKIGNKLVGPGQPCFVIAEIGINHNGDVDLAKRLISVAVAAGCDAVKFQKRTVDVVYTAKELATPRENPFGPTNGDLKYGLEFEEEEYEEIEAFCKSLKMMWFASPWG